MRSRNITSPLDLPEGSSGKIRLRHQHCKVGTVLPIISMRTAILTGQRPVSLRVTGKPLRIHELSERDRGVWMTDNPQELIQQYAFSVNPHGRVLVGGLGLGLVAHFIAQRKSVRQIDIVEINPDVIKLCSPGLPEKCNVIQADIRQFLLDLKGRWPYKDAYFDTWQATGEGAWIEHILPLRRILRREFGWTRSRFWAEDEMHGQVVRFLSHFATHYSDKHCWPAYSAFRRAAVEIGYPLGGFEELDLKKHLEAENDPKLQELIRDFLFDVGSENWEKTFQGAGQ